MNQLVNGHLEKTRKDLVKEMTSLSEAQFNSKADVYKWSIAQVCHHLVLVEKASLKAITWGLKGSNSRKNVPLVLLDRTKKIIAPKIVEPDKGPFEVEQVVNWLNDSREKLMNFLSTIEDKSILAEKSMKHPALGELPLDQWIEQIYLHEQRHIEQIKEIKLLLDAR
ncbi:DinB family protein [Shouchella clausii]|uniref:DinB family protein n=1 Tax=Shouchella clausii TaxID=79880 RepID=UPI000BA76E95|nr:DinB family protein [Shouchella clausii]PAD90587.1 PadR family transcriptional regulator [Shouchella clausii]